MKEYKLPIGCDVPETIILADGDFPSHPLALEWLRQCPYVVCCDGAANTYIRSGRMPEAIVGDGDSLLPGIKERYASLIHSETEQETNDLSKAFRFCLSQERKRITIMGATGKREDHTIGNVSLLADYMEKAEVNMMTDYGIFVPIKEDSMFESYIGQQISIFNMNSTVLFAEGLAYPLSVFTNWWQGTLNEALAKHFIIRTEGKVLVFRTFSKNEESFNFFYFVTDYASTAGTTETDLLSSRPTLKHTVPSTKAKRVWSRPIPMFSPGWNSVPL